MSKATEVTGRLDSLLSERVGPLPAPDVPLVRGGCYTEALVQKIVAEKVAAERDCRTCKNWTPHHRSDVIYCSAALRCVAGGSYQRQGVVKLWESAPVDAGF